MSQSILLALKTNRLPTVEQKQYRFLLKKISVYYQTHTVQIHAMLFKSQLYVFIYTIIYIQIYTNIYLYIDIYSYLYLYICIFLLNLPQGLPCNTTGLVSIMKSLDNKFIYMIDNIYFCLCWICHHTSFIVLRLGVLFLVLLKFREW